MKYLKISFIVLVGIFLGYWLVQIALTIWEKSSKAAVWSLVPADAVAVWQIPNIPQTYAQFDSTAIWQNLKTAPHYKILAERAKLMEIMAGEGIAIDNYFADKQVTISLHATAKGNFDFLFFIPVTIKDNAVFRQALQNVITRHQAKTENRNYQGIEIQEVKFPTQSQLFSYSIYKGYFVGSFTATLLEETIRNIGELGRENFYSANKKSFSLDKPDDKQTYCYINPKKTSTFLKIFCKDDVTPKLQGLQTFFEGGYYEITHNHKELLMNGLQYYDKEKSEIGLFAEMQPTPCDLLPQFLPKKTASLYRISFDDTEKFFQRLELYTKQSQDSIIKSNYIDFQEFTRFMEGEVALATLENIANSEAPKIVYVKVKKPLQLSNQLQKYAEELAKLSQDTVLYENFGGQKIVKLNYQEFPKMIFGEKFSGFRYTHFTFLNNYLLLGNSPKALATVLEDVENEQVWAKLFQTSPLVTELAKPSNFCYVENVLRSWNGAMQTLNPTWQGFFEQNKRQFLRFEFLLLQGQADEEIAKTNIAFLHKNYDSQQANKNIRVMYETNFYNSLITKSFVVKNPIDKSKEVLVQDAGNHLHLLAVNGKKLWHFAVGSPVVPQIYQMEVAKGQMQYLFAAQNKLYALDRNGNLAVGFPITLADCGEIEYLSLLDYDNTKNYRIAVADRNGNLFLLSKNGQILQGWQGKKIAGQLAIPITHIRAGSKDALLAMTKQGIIYLLKRNGELYPNFPVSVGLGVVNNYFLEPNSDFNKTVINVMTIQGEIIKINLAGKVVGREELTRPNTASIFRLLPDAVQANDFLLSRQDEKYITLFDKNLTQIFTLELPSKNENLVQYFNFGVNAEIIAITDNSTQTTSLLYKNGDKVCEPLASEQEITIFFNEIKNEYLIYTVKNNRVTAQRVAKL